MLICVPDSGAIMLCVEPTDVDSLHAVKWHPQDPALVAVASEKTVFLINIADAAHAFNGESIPQAEMHRVAQTYSVASVRILHIVALLDDNERPPANRRHRLRCAPISPRYDL